MKIKAQFFSYFFCRKPARLAARQARLAGDSLGESRRVYNFAETCSPQREFMDFRFIIPTIGNGSRQYAQKCLKPGFKHFSQGFSLIEMLIVVGIIGILVGISAKTIINLQPDLKLSGACRELITDIRYAQQLAVSEQVEHGLYLCDSEKRYEVRRYGETTEILKAVSFPEEIIEINISGLTSIDSNKEARYNFYGTVKDYGTISLKNSENKIKTIEIRPSGFTRTTN